jgi:hypothetical protein
MSAEPVALVVGNPVDGFVFHGPAYPDSAELEAMTEGLREETWWYAPLRPLPAALSPAAPPAALRWQSAGTDEPGDEFADSAITDPTCTSMYWSLGPAASGMWGVELIGVDEGDERQLTGVHLGHYSSAADAKTAAQGYEDSRRPGTPA